MKKKMKTVYGFLTFVSVVSLNAYMTSQEVLANEVTTQSSEQETTTTTSNSTSRPASVTQVQATTETASVATSASSNPVNDETAVTSQGPEAQQTQVQTLPSETSASSEKVTETSQDNQAQTSVGAIQAEAVSAVSTSSIAVQANIASRSAVNTQPAPEETTLVTIDADRIALQYTGQIPAGETIKFAVWSDTKGQDDLVWYQADVTGLAYLQLNRNKSYGLYHLHTYSFAGGRGPKGLKNQTFNLDKPQPKVDIEQTSNTNYRLRISEVGPTISRLKVPIWSGVNGQDDIKWYPANPKSDGTYQLDISVTDHQSNFGKYHVHVYGDSIIEGKTIALAATNGFEHWDNRPEPAVKLVHSSASTSYFDV
ncbi:TPA: GBS Bsp-like repeat-containing protein, partial [Streptococcus suis]